MDFMLFSFYCFCHLFIQYLQTCIVYLCVHVCRNNCFYFADCFVCVFGECCECRLIHVCMGGCICVYIIYHMYYYNIYSYIFRQIYVCYDLFLFVFFHRMDLKMTHYLTFSLSSTQIFPSVLGPTAQQYLLLVLGKTLN